LTGTSHIDGIGNSLDNLIIGNSGNNRLDGGESLDTLQGGSGNDTYVVDNVGDVVFENLNEGTDTVEASINYTLTGHVENLTLTGTDDLNGTGNDLNNLIIGNSGNNRLNGGAGVDTLQGGAGNDTYVVNNVGDVVSENLNEGTDTVEAAITYTLTPNVENLTLTGSSNINGTGNELNNLIIGNNGNNRLNGGTGADTMRGGDGNDIYVVDNAGDMVTELDGQGTDTVEASVNYTLTNHVENLVLKGNAKEGAGNKWDNTLTANDLGNSLSGFAGKDTLIGGKGNDTLNGGEGADTIYGGAGGDTIDGGTEGDFIDGGSGSDVLTGGDGNDTIYSGSGPNDEIYGGAGDDYLVGAAGSHVEGGEDNDENTQGLCEPCHEGKSLAERLRARGHG
jgi:Ca2+-binding RTX toxin-like protein